MTGVTHYKSIPFLTKMFNIVFYIYWKDGKFNRLGFKKKRILSLEECVKRLESKRIMRNYYENKRNRI